MKKAVLGLAMVLPMMSGGAFAGSIMFGGQLSADTCKVTIEGEGVSGSNVVLPVVSTSQLNRAGKVTGRTDFKLVLTDCPADGNVTTFFTPGPGGVNAEGRLVNTSVNVTAAEGVSLQLIEDDTPIDVSDLTAQQSTNKSHEVIDGKAELDYAIEYYAEGDAVTAGPLITYASYSIVYD